MNCQILLPCILLSIFGDIHCQTGNDGTGLPITKHVVMDKSRPLPGNWTVRSVKARFHTKNAIWVQLWQSSDQGVNLFELIWQVMITPTEGDGRNQCIMLAEEDQVMVPDRAMLAIVNEGTPGPLRGNYKMGSGTVLSINPKPHGQKMNLSEVSQYDNLKLPYHLPVYLSADPTCAKIPTPYPPPATTPGQKVTPERIEQPTNTPPGGDPDISRNLDNTSFLMTESMILGLVLWNVLLTCFLLLGIIVFVCFYGRRRTHKPLGTPASNSAFEGDSY